MAKLNNFFAFSMEPLKPRVNLFESLTKWQTHSDREYGGMSSVKVTDLPDTGGIALAGSMRALPANIRKIAKGTFVSVRSLVDNGHLDLRDYKGLELDIRNKSNRVIKIAINLGCFSMVDDDLYQARYT